MALCYLPSVSNTGAAPTFSPSSLTAHPVVKPSNGTALIAGDILIGIHACVIYNATATDWELQNPQTTPTGTVDNNTLASAFYCPDTSGTPNAITCTTTTTFPGSYAAGQTVRVKLANTITGATTINVHSLGTKAVTKNGATALAGTESLTAGTTFTATYDGTEFVIYSPAGGGSGTVTSLVFGLWAIRGGTITTSGNVAVTVGIDTQTGSGAFAIPSTDCGKLVKRSQAAAVSDTLAQAGTGGFTTGWFTSYICLGAGGCTITPATSTINGASNLGLTTNQSADIVSDGTNYSAKLGAGSGR